MKYAGLIFILLLTGCVSGSRDAAPVPPLVGMFCHSSIDAADCLELKPDLSYAENFFGGGVQVIESDGKVPEMKSEPRDSGHWQQTASEVRLISNQGKRRVLKIEERKGKTVLLEIIKTPRGKFIRDYEQ